MVINLQQAPAKFFLGCNKTLAPNETKITPIAGWNDKRTITTTYHIWWGKIQVHNGSLFSKLLSCLGKQKALEQRREITKYDLTYHYSVRQ